MNWEPVFTGIPSDSSFGFRLIINLENENLIYSECTCMYLSLLWGIDYLNNMS